MMAIHRAQALSVLTDYGLAPSVALTRLARIKPAAHYAGDSYYSTARVYRAAKAKG